MNLLSAEGYSRSLRVIATLALVLSSAPVLSQESFYNGNSVHLLIGGSPGGGYDTYARHLARHMGRHIPGGPNFVPGTCMALAELLVANHLFNVAPKDGGTVASFPHGVAMEPLFGNTAAKFNPSEFNWIGSANDEVSVCARSCTRPPGRAGRSGRIRPDRMSRRRAAPPDSGSCCCRGRGGVGRSRRTD